MFWNFMCFFCRFVFVVKFKKSYIKYVLIYYKFRIVCNWMGRICYFYLVLIFGGMYLLNVNFVFVNFIFIEYEMKMIFFFFFLEGKKFKIINNLLYFLFIKYFYYLYIEIVIVRWNGFFIIFIFFKGNNFV